MNTNQIKTIKVLLCSLLLMTLLACRTEEIDTNPDKGLIPVVLTTNVTRISTKVNGSFFENGDEIGLFLLEQPNVLTGNRYADNLRFVCNGTEWEPDSPLFFPIGESKSDFIAYYPYHSNALSEGKTSLMCEVKADQSIKGNYSLSDFLVSVSNNIEPTEEAVSLNFKHKLTAIEIIIDPGTAYPSAQALLDTHPVITVKDVCTTVTYDFTSEKLTSPTNQKDIIPAGEFTVENNKLIGKKLILVPQTISDGHLLIELVVKGTSYNFTLGEKHEYLPATKETCTLTLKSSPTAVPGKILTSVSKWDNESNYWGDLEENNKPSESNAAYFSVSVPNFSESSVYKVMNGNVQIAEICREYLNAPNGKDGTISNQAVVIYPFVNNIADLTKGIVLQVLDGNAGNPLTTSLHGGKASWNMSTHTLSYTKGTSVPLTTVYVDKQRNILTSLKSDNIALSQLTPDVLKDTRDNNIYPIVKIGTQYWMGSNLRATTYTDRSPIGLQESNEEWEAASSGYCRHYKTTSEILYKIGVLSKNIAPAGWSVPSKSECEKLAQYIEYEAVFIQNDSWRIKKPELNLTGFSADKMGLRYADGTFYDDSPGFWHSEEGYFCFNGNLFSIQSDKTISGCSIRCIKK